MMPRETRRADKDSHDWAGSPDNMEQVQYSDCQFCRRENQSRKRSRTKKIVNGLARLFKLKRRRPRGEVDPVMEGIWFSYVGLKKKDPAWEKWWKAQEPRET
jgi:hypothetical protein